MSKHSKNRSGKKKSSSQQPASKTDRKKPISRDSTVPPDQDYDESIESPRGPRTPSMF
ncbi:MAG: hypothetical protein J7501_08470 [Bdellovibrio sp.]|nr:hypothetical protein [Bdellovibrio sp.]